MSEDLEFSEVETGMAMVAREQVKEERALVREALGRDAVSRAAQKELAKRRFTNSLSPAEMGAVVEYARELGIGINGLDVLFGQLYVNADGYFEKAAQVFPDGTYDPINISEDAALRKEWGVPECAQAAYLIRYWKDRRYMDAGARWDAQEVGYAPSNLKDDAIGKANPFKSARTRGARRTLRTVIPFFSKTAAAIEERFKVMAEQSKAIGRASDEAEPNPPMVHPADPYDDLQPVGNETRTEALRRPIVEPAHQYTIGPTPEQKLTLDDLLAEGGRHLTQDEHDKLKALLQQERNVEWWGQRIKLIRDIIQNRADTE